MSQVGKDQGKGNEAVAGGSKIPAGLETLFAMERENVKSALGALILAVHWSIVRAGLRIPLLSQTTSDESKSSKDKTYTERLPSGWAEGIINASNAVFTLDYGDPAHGNVSYQVKVIEIVKDHTAVVTVYKCVQGRDTSEQAGSSSNEGQGSQAGEQKTSASTFQLANFIQFDEAQAGNEDVTAHQIFVKAEDLEKQIWTELMEPVGLKVIGLPPFQSPYDDKVKTETRARSEDNRQPIIISPGERDPLRDDRFPSRGPFNPFGPGMPRAPVPGGGPPGGFGPFSNPMGGGGLGRSDLDPLGGFGTGMIADPRGFRSPRVGPGRLPPGAVPPGARFDPFGPPNPNPGAPNPNWAVPNPDEPPPPGFDDMFM